ncbi:hypothetical protein V8E36_006066, partial [Tilletia maclaganii]
VKSFPLFPKSPVVVADGEVPPQVLRPLPAQIHPRPANIIHLRHMAAWQYRTNGVESSTIRRYRTNEVESSTIAVAANIAAHLLATTPDSPLPESWALLGHLYDRVRLALVNGRHTGKLLKAM